MTVFENINMLQKFGFLLRKDAQRHVDKRRVHNLISIVKFRDTMQ